MASHKMTCNITQRRSGARKSKVRMILTVLCGSRFTRGAADYRAPARLLIGGFEGA